MKEEDDYDEEQLTNSNKKNLTTMKKHTQLREEADKHYLLNAERMKLKYSNAKRRKVYC